MNFTEEKMLCDTITFKILYYASALIMSFLFAITIVLSFSTELSAVPFLLVGAGCFVLFCLAVEYVKRKQSALMTFFYALTASLFCTYGMMLFIKAEKSLIWLLLYLFCLYFIMQNLRLKVTGKVSAAAFLLGVVFGSFLFVGYQLEQSGGLTMLHILDDRYSVLLLLAQFAGICLLLVTVLNPVLCWGMNCDLSQDTKKLPTLKKSRNIYIVVAILLLWFPYYYAFYPGVLTFDSFGEIRQQMGLDVLSNHHPVAHQLLIGLSIRLGGNVPQKGVGIYSAIQMLVLAMAFGACLAFLRRKGINRFIFFSVFCFYAIFPVNGMYSITMWKDVLFGAACLIFTMLLVHHAQENELRLFWWPLTAVAAFLFCVLRNNGWYAFIIGFPLYTLFVKKDRKKLIALFALVVLLVCAYNHVIFDVLGVKRSATGEALSVPLQQIARTVKEQPQILASEEAEILREIFPELDSLGEYYAPTISDPVKDPKVFRSEVFDEDPIRYIRVWAKLGINYPLGYLEAFLMQNYGYWYTDTTRWIVAFDAVNEELGISQLPERSAMRHEIIKVFRLNSEQRPTAVLFSLGLMVWLMMIAAVLLILKGQRGTVAALFIPGGLWLTTLASPVYCEYRYMYGFVVCVPLFLALALGMKKRESQILAVQQ